ncbi:helix-turn-helix transcriptional regulator [Loktanella atrilutea]|uniref:helix-turn-helix transcriptional regulator n=1 Tax=Loktanella atrilutea TaxID=366533 RepID=UPI00093481F0|nr:helix-turn-helix transcriptional regulator [Loktanella atrilutea]
MDIEEKERLTGFRDTSDEAISRRLAAARIATGLGQRDLAEAMGKNHKTYAYQEKAGRPSVDVIRFLYRNHNIDFNFILHGDFQHLPIGVQAKLFEALSSLSPSGDLRTSSR